MIEIQDYPWNDDIGKYLSLRIMTFEPNPANGVHLYWSIYNADNQMFKDGNLHFDKELYDAWGDDDNYLIDWVLEQLELTRA